MPGDPGRCHFATDPAGTVRDDWSIIKVQGLCLLRKIPEAFQSQGLCLRKFSQAAFKLIADIQQSNGLSFP